MREFIYFIKHFAKYFWMSRGVIISLFLFVAINGLIISFLENKTISDAMYFIFVTALSIGYGDITPATGVGRIISILTGLFGMVFIGLIVAIATLSLKNAISDLKTKKGKRK